MQFSVNVTIAFFKLNLFVFLGYMVYTEISQYFANEDVSSLLYKEFDSHDEDIYPTFSVCIVYFNGGLFKEKLKGLSRLYWKFLVGNDIRDKRNFSSMNYDDVLINVSGLFEKYQRKSKEKNKKATKEIFLEFDDVFEIIHQDPKEVCFTKKQRKEEGRLFDYDFMRFDAKWILSSDRIEYHVYIHQKEQLIRRLTKPTFIIYGKRLRKGKLKGEQGFKYIVRMRSNAVEVLRRRPDAIEACNDSLVEDDNQWRKSVVEKIQCVPTFMERFFPNTTDTWPNCNPDQLKIAQDLYSPQDNFEAGARHYLPPCTQISTVVTIAEDIERLENENVTSLILRFEYPTLYRETINKREFSVYELWSQIGGIMGMIVGYSLMQIPDTCKGIFVWINTIFRRTKIITN